MPLIDQGKLQQNIPTPKQTRFIDEGTKDKNKEPDTTAFQFSSTFTNILSMDTVT